MGDLLNNFLKILPIFLDSNAPILKESQAGKIDIRKPDSMRAREYNGSVENASAETLRSARTRLLYAKALVVINY